MKATTLPIDKAALLAQTAKAASIGGGKKGRSDTPEGVLPDEYLPDIARIFELKRFKKDLDAEQGLIESRVYPGLNAERIALCRQLNRASGSAKFSGVMFITQRPWQTKVHIDRKPELDQIFGPARPLYYAEEYTYKVNPLELTAEQVQALAALGIVPEVCLVPTDKLHQDVTLDPEVQARADAAGYKPTMYVKE